MADDEKVADLLNKLEAIVRKKGDAKRTAQFDAIKTFLDLKDANFDFKFRLELLIPKKFYKGDTVCNFAVWLTYKIMNGGECDDCDLSRAVYKILWDSEVSWYPPDFKSFCPDTMNTLAKTLEKYLLNHKKKDEFDLSIPPQEKMSVLKIAKNFGRKSEQGYENIMEFIEPGLWEQWNIFARNVGCLGNFVLVPPGFNTHRNNIAHDYWNYSLKLLKDNNYLKKGRNLKDTDRDDGGQVWKKVWFEKYINTFFLWDYVDEKFTPCPLFGGNASENDENAFTYPKTDEFQHFLANANRLIERRSIFMTAMLDIAIYGEYRHEEGLDDKEEVKKRLERGEISKDYNAIMQYLAKDGLGCIACGPNGLIDATVHLCGIPGLREVRPKLEELKSALERLPEKNKSWDDQQ